MIDIALHLHSGSGVVEKFESQGRSWVDVRPDGNDPDSEVTFFVGTPAMAERLASAFAACGLKRIVQKGNAPDATQSEACGTAQ